MRSARDVECALERYGDSAMGLACGLLRSEADAFDVTQETFTRYFTSDAVFESDRHEKNWLLKVAGNLCRDELRKARRRYEFPSGVDVAEVPAASPALAYYEVPPDFSEDHTVWECVGRLPPLLRQMVHLRYVEELDTSEIADMLKTTEVNVRVSLHRARKRLREMTESREDERKGEGNV